jgi:hypothetical protein
MTTPYPEVAWLEFVAALDVYRRMAGGDDYPAPAAL